MSLRVRVKREGDRLFLSGTNERQHGMALGFFFFFESFLCTCIDSNVYPISIKYFVDLRIFFSFFLCKIYS
jgi:hypothetical protein